jgi:hypothetical protein
MESMTHAERQVAIQKIAALPAQLEALIAARADSDLNKNYGPGKWTARQVIHHLADSHIHSFIRMRYIATTDNPTIQPYDQNAWAELPDASTGPIAPSLEILKGVHARWTAFLKALPDEAFSRNGFHPERGPVTLDDLVRIYAGHGEKHLEHIRTAINS